MLVYQSKNPIYIQDNKMKGIDTRMVTSFSGLDSEIEKFLTRAHKKFPDNEYVMIFYTISNVHGGKPILVVHGAETPTLILMARFEFANVTTEPVYLVEDMSTISLDGHTYTKFVTHLATDFNVTKTFWSQSLGIITDQSLIDKLEWHKIT